MLLFVHGFPEFWYEWEYQLQVFGQRYYAVAVDLRGFNDSEHPQELEQYKAKHIIADLSALVKALGYENCMVVAHDWGGAITWGWAAMMPQLIRKLVIINAPHTGTFLRELRENPAQAAASRYMNWLRQKDAAQKLAENNFERIKGMFQGGAWFTEEVSRHYVTAWKKGLEGGLNYYRASPLHPPEEGKPHLQNLPIPLEMLKVEVPTLVIWGMQDKALLPSLLDGLNEYVSHLQIVRIPEGSHWVIHEYPEEINGLIAEFIG